MARPGRGDEELLFEDDVDLDQLPSAPPRARGDRPGAVPARSVLGTWPERTPPWLRSPLAVLLVTLLAIAVTAALLDRRATSATRDAVAVERALLSLDAVDAVLSATTSVDPLTRNSFGTGTPQTALLEVTVVNRGGQVAVIDPLDLALDGFPDAALEPSGPVVATGTGTPRGVSAPQPATGPLSVAAGGRSRGVVPFAVDCSVVPPPDELASGDGDQLVASVRVLGTERVEQLPLGGGSEGLSQRLARRCHPDAEVAVRVVSSEITADGGLEVALQNQGTAPARVDLAGRPAQEVTAEPALPLDLRPGRVTRVVLTGAPDCGVARDPLGEGLVLRALPVEALDRGATATLDAAMAGAWWVRVVALACG